MVTQEQGLTDVEGVSVYDCIVVSQVIDKLLRGGLVAGREVGHIAVLRQKIVSAVERAVGVNIDADQKEG